MATGPARHQLYSGDQLPHMRGLPSSLAQMAPDMAPAMALLGVVSGSRTSVPCTRKFGMPLANDALHQMCAAQGMDGACKRCVPSISSQLKATD